MSISEALALKGRVAGKRAAPRARWFLRKWVLPTNGGYVLVNKISIQFTLFSAFYSPLISAMSGGFLRAEGLDPEWSISPPGSSALAALEDGSAHVVQSALSQGFTSLNQGKTPTAVHFAQVNEMDGFFLTGRDADPAFTWDKLEGAEVVMLKGGQPMAMFKYACYKAGIDFNKVRPIFPGGAAEIDQAFRSGKGQYVHHQGPFPQQLQADGIGHIIAQVGKQIGPCGFSSLAATRDWLGTDMAKAFMRAYRKTRMYMSEAPASEIAEAEKPYFPNIDEDVLADCVATYQRLGCWTPHVEITRAAYEKTLDVFQYVGMLKERYRYEQVCTEPPAID
jgi:NitT/TauT family transport system substrate-binding protein